MILQLIVQHIFWNQKHVPNQFKQARDLSDFNWNQTHNHLVHKRTLDHLAKLVNWLSCVVSTCLYGAFDCMFLSCHVCISKWMHTV